MARTVARILSKKYHQDTGLTLKPWNRTIWNMITNRRNLHLVYAHCTQLRSTILIQSEDKARDTLANEEALDFGLILTKHMSLLPHEKLELSMEPQSSKQKSSQVYTSKRMAYSNPVAVSRLCSSYIYFWFTSQILSVRTTVFTCTSSDVSTAQCPPSLPFAETWHAASKRDACWLVISGIRPHSNWMPTAFLQTNTPPHRCTAPVCTVLPSGHIAPALAMSGSLHSAFRFSAGHTPVGLDIFGCFYF